MELKNLTGLFILISALFFTFANLTFADEFTLIERTVESAYYKNIDIKSYTGSVTIKTWDKLAVNVGIRGNQEALKNVDYKIDNKDGNITVTTSPKDDMNKANTELKIEVLVPRYFNPTVKTSGGEIKIINLTGNVKLETTGADIYISEYAGESDLKTTGGNIKLSTFKGPVIAYTTGGNINLDGSEGEIKAETSGGDIKVKYTGNNLGMTLKTTGGDIKVILPETFKAMLDATAIAGEIKTDFSVLVNKDVSGQTLNGIINGGGNIIKCTTTGGKIAIIK
jgi:hypothetical protein